MDPTGRIPGVPDIPGMPGGERGADAPRSGDGADPAAERRAARERPRADPTMLDAQRARLGDDISAYPGSITYIDLIAKNKRASAMLIVAMVLLVGALFAAVVSAAVVWGGGSETLVPAALTGLIAGVLFAALGATWSWFGGSAAILRMSGACEVRHGDDAELFNVVDEMRIAAGLPMPRVFMVEDSALNAFATGRDPEHAVVAITRGLREKLTRDELQGVIAHEVAHIRHYDIRFSLLMATMVGLIVFAADAFLRTLRRMRFSGGGRRSSGKGGGAAVLVVVVIAIVLAILAPFLAQVIQMAYSRKREYLADAGAVELTRNPEGLASALSTLAMDSDPLVDAANRGTAHMFIANPLRRARATKGEHTSLFSSHPPISERIAALLALAR